MDEHVRDLMAELPRADDLRYAIATLQIEWGRLTESVREMQSLPTTADDYLEQRVKQQREALNSIEASIRSEFSRLASVPTVAQLAAACRTQPRSCSESQNSQRA